MTNSIKLSIVSTMYLSEDYIAEFYDRTLQVIKDIGIEAYEFVLVDDGSPDTSLDKAIALSEKDPRVKVLELSRNFGHHKAMLTGLKRAAGQYVFLIDMDLEEAPELLGDFWKALHDGADIDVVYGVQEERKGGFVERLTGIIYYRVFNWLSDHVAVDRNLLTVRLMKRCYVQQLVLFEEEEFYLGPTCNLVGFRQERLVVTKNSLSPTTYNFAAKYNLLINSVFSYSKRPLYFIFYFGLVVTVFASAYGGNLVYRKLVNNVGVDGWVSLMVSIWFFGGVIILFLGIIAIYLSKIFSETKRRPFSIVRKVHGGDCAGDTSEAATFQED